MIKVLNSCVGCAKCVKACPFGAIKMEGRLAAITLESCTACGACVQACPAGAILIERSQASADLSGYKGIWVFTELSPDGKAVRPVAHELLSCGRKLAEELGEELCAVLLGDGVSGLCAELASYGADKIYLCEHKSLSSYDTDAYYAAMSALITKHKPSSVLYPSTYLGRDLAPRVAAGLCVGLTADCTGLSIKDGNLLQTRPAFGGNIMADILSPATRPQMATVRPNVMKKNPPRQGVKAVVIEEKLALASAKRVKVLERKLDHSHLSQGVAGAQVVISGGRGMKDERGFEILEELAEVLGGAVGASRAAVDMGLKPKPHQVGQSGTTVSPKLYLACGISGAVQHLVGMSSSDVIIAINKDPDAPIFGVAKHAVVGDAHQILPRLAEKLRKLK